MANSMSGKAQQIPRIGVPYRSVKEEAENRRDAYDNYLRALREAGGEPVEISLVLSRPRLGELARTLDGIVLPGSPADVDPKRYGAPRHPRSGDPDPQREQTDFTLLDAAFAANKPVLAICYGVQLLNVYLGGSLVQDIPSELASEITHDWRGRASGAPEPFHAVGIEAGTRLVLLAGGTEARVNSSHHQSVHRPGSDLRVVARAPDGVVEAVEFTGKDQWVMGVQWHPERMKDDGLSEALFRDLIAAARAAFAGVRG